MKRGSVIAALAAVSVLSTAALAHPFPKTADPKPNAVLTTSPAVIRIGFSEGLVTAFSGVGVDDANGASVAGGTASADPNDSKLIILPLTANLAPGAYTVEWHAVGDDTHRVAGHFTFQVKF